MRRAIVVAALVSVVSLPATAATILERDIDLTIDDRTLTERIRLKVSIDESGDLSDWSDYVFYLDEHIELVECDAQILNERDVPVESIPERKFHRETSVGSSLHTSTTAIIVPFENLSVGQQISIDLIRRYQPLFLAYSVRLVTEEPQLSLKVRVRGGDDQLRWTLQAADGVVTMTEADGGFDLNGTDIGGRIEVDHAPDADAALPTLRFAWNDTPTWRGVGAWYSRLVNNPEPRSTAAEKLAESLTGDAETNRERLVILADYAKKSIRYEAVEIGEGGWVPSSADQVLKRGWGDCKDKAQLLVEMLRAVGIPSHLVLLRAGRKAQIDVNFPSTLGFNHCITAVPVSTVETDQDDPVVDGYLFIDTTMDRGHPLWLSPYNQGQWAVVAAGDDSHLVQLPVLTNDEHRLLLVEGAVSPDGVLESTAVLRLTGAWSLSWVRDLDREAPERIDERIRYYLQSAIPGATFTNVGWREIEGRVPSIHLQADVTVEDFVRGTPGRRSIRPGLLTSFPEARELDDRQQPLVLPPGRHHTVWRLRLPSDWCPPVATEELIQNSVGRISGSTTLNDDGVVVIDRQITVFRWWFGLESFAHLRELCVAENKLHRRSTRFRCDSEGESTPD